MLFIAKVRVTRVTEIVVCAKDEAHARELLANPEPEWDWRDSDDNDCAPHWTPVDWSVNDLHPATVESVAALDVSPDFTPYGDSDAFAETVAECFAYELEEFPVGRQAMTADAWVKRWADRVHEFKDRIDELRAAATFGKAR